MRTRTRPGRLTPRALGLLFLIPGLVVGVPSLIFGAFHGAVQGFCVVAVLFGGLMLLVRSDPEPA